MILEKDNEKMYLARHIKYRIYSDKIVLLIDKNKITVKNQLFVLILKVISSKAFSKNDLSVKQLQAYNYFKDNNILEDVQNMEYKIDKSSVLMEKVLINTDTWQFVEISTKDLQRIDKEPNTGVIRVNGMDIRDIKMRTYYQYVLYVSQKPIIFRDTLINNIVFYADYSDAEIEEVVQVCQLSAFYNQMKYRQISDQTISGGQAQRISLAQALLKKPKLLLLDEPTSALDHNMGIRLTQNLQQYCAIHDILLLIISHRQDIMSICPNKYILDHHQLNKIHSE